MNDQPTKQTIPNPARGCGHLEPGKAYIRGIGGDGDGILPSFVRCDPPIPHREIGTEGSFTRSFQQIDGLTFQLATNEQYDYVPLTPTGEYGESAYEKMEKVMDYESRMGIPSDEVDRHIDRVRLRARLPEDDPQSIVGRDWGHSPVGQQTDLLMRAGESYYPDPEDFIAEARRHGLSKAIPTSPTRDPPDVIPGITRCWVMSPTAGDNDFGGAIIGYAYIGQVVFTEPDDGQVPQYIEEYEEQGKLDVVEIEEPQEAGADGHKNMTITEAVDGGEA